MYPHIAIFGRRPATNIILGREESKIKIQGMSSQKLGPKLNCQKNVLDLHRNNNDNDTKGISIKVSGMVDGEYIHLHRSNNDNDKNKDNRGNLNYNDTLKRHLHKSQRHGDGAETEVREGKVGDKNIPAFNIRLIIFW